MDLIAYLPTYEGFDLDFTIVDSFSKYVTFLPCKSTCTAPDLDGILYDHIICKLGMPKKIVSNKYIRFLSNFL